MAIISQKVDSAKPFPPRMIKETKATRLSASVNDLLYMTITLSKAGGEIKGSGRNGVV